MAIGILLMSRRFVADSMSLDERDLNNEAGQGVGRTISSGAVA
jgi:hypothetical protein